MLTVHKINLLAGASVVQQPVLRREEIANFFVAQQACDIANLHARETIKHAQLAAERIRHQAYEEVSKTLWKQAQVLLNDWQKEREEMRKQTVGCAKQLLTQALRLAFDKEPAKARIQTLLKQLQKHPEVNRAAMLMVNPRQYEQAEQFLNAQGDTPWTLVSDPRQAKDELCLKSPHGKYTIGWQTFTDSFLSAITESAATTRGANETERGE
ncbi:HrpE/YscL family type III secretion apparatus protein [Kosakonia sacchari]|uniref:HrpE/YscL family type III secretion apparatus protein n=1 Tax=Kosakonia sacchari TaxID=1158459 RepID=UPI000BE4C271|nr:HrpE/YscL family type III secretion apparatus protein [Kosakonia sacchari]PDO83510.1 hypothetical protein BK797_16510 [Kosakonia sacchari]